MHAPATMRPVATLVLAALLAVGISACAREAASEFPTIKQVNASVIDAPPEVAYENATVVLRGRVTGRGDTVRVDIPVEGAREPGKVEPWVYTEWHVIPTEIYKTDGRVSRGEPVRVAARGGTLDDLTVEHFGEATFTPGEDVVLFLIPSDGAGTETDGRYFTFAMAEGKYSIEGTRAVTRNSTRNTTLPKLESKLKKR